MSEQLDDTTEPWLAIDHVQIAIPVGGEAAAREFYAGVLGLSATWSDEIPGTVRCHIADPFGNRIELIEGP